MSFKDKAREVRDAGAAERGNYSPKADSLPLRMYQSWANKRPHKVPTRENFCHYWRVVAIWAPLWAIWQPLEDFLNSKVGAILGASIVLLGFAGLLSLGGSTAWGVLGLIALTAYLLASVVLGVVSGATWGRRGNDFVAEEGWRWNLIFFPSFLVFGPTVLIRKGWAKIPDGFKSVDEDLGFKVAMGVFGILIAALLVSGTIRWVWFVPVILGAVLVLIGIGVGLSFLADWLKLRHRKAVEARTTYQTDDFYGYERIVKVIEPSRVAKFFMAIGDFLNLAFQVVRVKKWKICPIVEIPTNE